MCTDFYIYKIRLDPITNAPGEDPTEDTIYYIGETKDIRKRLTAHIHGNRNSSRVIIDYLYHKNTEYYVSNIEEVYLFSNYHCDSEDSFFCNVENLFYSLERLKGIKRKLRYLIFGAFNTQSDNYDYFTENNNLNDFLNKKVCVAKEKINNLCTNCLNDELFNCEKNAEHFNYNNFEELFNGDSITANLIATNEPVRQNLKRTVNNSDLNNVDLNDVDLNNAGLFELFNRLGI